MVEVRGGPTIRPEHIFVDVRSGWFISVYSSWFLFARKDLLQKSERFKKNETSRLIYVKIFKIVLKTITVDIKS